ncbi:hypothetical protein BDL97_02G101400 [Sphagnum fallax]|jgi:hypothetical protein|nr:hypothetical protein BDL97_02G101400 [Sphagnum fallax]
MAQLCLPLSLLSPSPLSSVSLSPQRFQLSSIRPHKLRALLVRCCSVVAAAERCGSRDDDDDADRSLLSLARFVQGCECLRCGKKQQVGGRYGMKQWRWTRRGSERRLVLARVSEVSGSGSGEGATASTKEDSKPRAKLSARLVESYEIEEMQRPLAEYMSLPVSQYSVLDAERIERVDDTMFKCYVHRLKFLGFEVGPVLLVAVEAQPNGCCIRLLSCTLEGSPIVVAQNKKFSASMSNKVSWTTVSDSSSSPSARRLVSDTTIEVTIQIPFAFRALPVESIEGTGNKVLSQLLKVVLPRFLTQLGKDYYTWASGDMSRKPVGNGQL